MLETKDVDQKNRDQKIRQQKIRAQKTRKARPIFFLVAAGLWIGVSQKLWSEMPSEFTLPFSELEQLKDEARESLDFRSCYQNPDGLRVNLKITENRALNPELLMNREYRLSSEVTFPSARANGANLTYRWTVRPPVASQISETPQYNDGLTLKPDQPGLYRIRLALFKQNQLCDFKEVIIDVPDVASKPRAKLNLNRKRMRQTA